jgi:hypothetical protein
MEKVLFIVRESLLKHKMPFIGYICIKSIRFIIILLIIFYISGCYLSYILVHYLFIQKNVK